MDRKRVDHRCSGGDGVRGGVGMVRGWGGDGVSVSSNRVLAMFTQQKQCETTADRGTISGMHGDDESEDIADMGNPVGVHTVTPMGIPRGDSFWVPAWVEPWELPWDRIPQQTLWGNQIQQ